VCRRGGKKQFGGSVKGPSSVGRGESVGKRSTQVGRERSVVKNGSQHPQAASTSQVQRGAAAAGVTGALSQVCSAFALSAQLGTDVGGLGDAQ